MSKVRFKGQLILPVVGTNPVKAQFRFLNKETTLNDMLGSAQSLFKCDNLGNYDFEVHVGFYSVSYSLDGVSFSAAKDILIEELPAGVVSTEFGDILAVDSGSPELPEHVQIFRDLVAEAKAANESALEAEANIDELVDKTEQGYPDLVAGLFYTNRYVDNVNGNDENDGKSFANAKKTIKAALDSTIDAAFLVVNTASTGVDYDISSDISTDTRRITFKHKGYVQGDVSTYGVINQLEKKDSPSFFSAYKFSLGASSTIHFEGYKIKTAKFDQPGKDFLYNHVTALFVNSTSSAGGHVVFYRCLIEINNTPLSCNSGLNSMGCVNISMVNTQIMPLPPLSVSDANRVILSRYGVIHPPVFFLTEQFTNSSGIEALDLIDANKDFLTTNLKSGVVATKGLSRYYNFDEESAKEAGIEVEYSLALTEHNDLKLFESEKAIASKILEDYNLGTGGVVITLDDINDIKSYVQSIDPSNKSRDGRGTVPRPSIFDRYK